MDRLTDKRKQKYFSFEKTPVCTWTILKATAKKKQVERSKPSASIAILNNNHCIQGMLLLLH